MSLSGYNSVQLEKERREQLRVEQVCSKTQALLTACESTIASVKDAALQQLVAHDLKTINKRLDEVKETYRTEPDQSLRAIETTQQRLHKAIAEAQAKANEWSKQQIDAAARLEATRSRVTTARHMPQHADSSALAKASLSLAGATTDFQHSRFNRVVEACDEAETHLKEASAAALNESIRRETVKGLLGTLTSMGFVVEAPKRTHADVVGGIVNLIGKLPSGRIARFEIQIDGTMRYDFDGYEDRACGKDLQKIEGILKERCNIKLGPPQITWKNPDRISKGARNLPATGRVQQH